MHITTEVKLTARQKIFSQFLTTAHRKVLMNTNNLIRKYIIYSKLNMIKHRKKQIYNKCKNSIENIRKINRVLLKINQRGNTYFGTPKDKTIYP